MRALAVLLLTAAAGCSGLKTYPTEAGGNLAVRTQVESGVKAALHIHRLDEQCRTQYQGSVQLDSSSLALAIPAGQASYLVVAFDTSSFLGPRRSTSAAMLFTPRPGNRYELSVRYRDSVYDVALTESDARGRERRSLPRHDLDACRAGS
jgi:hypothetical protein